MSKLEFVLMLFLLFLIIGLASSFLIRIISKKIDSKSKDIFTDCSDIEKRVVVFIVILLSTVIFFACSSFITSKYLELNVDTFSYILLIDVYLCSAMIIGAILTFIISIIAIMKCIKKRKNILIIFAVIIFVAILCFNFKKISSAYLDYKQKDFISYSGEFRIVNQSWKNNSIFIEGEKELISSYSYETGVYYGEIIYAKRSEQILLIKEIQKR